MTYQDSQQYSGSVNPKNALSNSIEFLAFLSLYESLYDGVKRRARASKRLHSPGLISDGRTAETGQGG